MNLVTEDSDDYLANDADDQREDDYVDSEPWRHPYFDNNFRDQQAANRKDYDYFEPGISSIPMIWKSQHLRILLCGFKLCNSYKT